ncbi:CHAD domain-containing protein [Aurantimonas sp. A3-2-R12]|uniref:CHAD domain-containing protein n=1 Tax=Aurantimonas sp. A3-2-R12 TaxID=3114362 RepID=UPI002E17EFF9|nr:CHAD domain-containing protein [Aurantimonas sp. A3-2-R12]
MAFRIDPGQALDAEFRRIAGEQLRKAERELGEAGGDRHAAVHSARKRLKKLRGLLRLVRDADADFYAEENPRFRDTARELSAVRDTAAQIEALDALEERFAGEVETKAFATIHARLIERRDAAAASEAEMGAAVEMALSSLGEARRRLDGFVVRRPDGNGAALAAKGFGRTYARARQALKQAEKRRDAESLHELRKRVKYHWMHLRLLAPVWPEAFAPLQEAAKTIADDLGLDHDYAVFRAEAAETPTDFGSSSELSVVLALMDRRQSELRQSGLDAARRLLAEEAEAAGRRIRRLVKAAATVAGRDPDAPAEAPEAGRRRVAAS